LNPLYRLLATALALLITAFANPALAAEPPLKLGVGLFQPDREKERRHLPAAGGTTFPPSSTARSNCARWIAGKASPKSLANGETDLALMGPWGYVLANHQAGAQVISTILV
jgi:phosphonate transport system substrate-binding protein